jgi:uncharacterized protein YjbJ (UPF0337 family)
MLDFVRPSSGRAPVSKKGGLDVRTKTLRKPLSSVLNEQGEWTMDKDRIKGSAKRVKGAVKEAAGKVLGDKKLETEGKTEKAVGKVQNAVGGLKDTLRGK